MALVLVLVSSVDASPYFSGGRDRMRKEGTVSSFAQSPMPSRQTSVLPASSPLRHFESTSACDISRTSRPATFTIQPSGVVGDGASELASGSERWAVVVESVSQVLSMVSELSMAIREDGGAGAGA